jgi:hypothetical protein
MCHCKYILYLESDPSVFAMHCTILLAHRVCCTRSFCRYHTTVIFGTTQEYATYSNGSLAVLRIINANRSPRAVLNYTMKFGITVTTETIKKFKELVIAFVKDRPREWLAFSAFRLTRIEADLGFVEYKTILQHRESWQQIGALLTSLAEVQSYAYDMSQEMNMGYTSPSLPVEVRVASAPGAEQGASEPPLQAETSGLDAMTAMLLGGPR